jgi:D-cysteine desulfhydrase
MPERIHDREPPRVPLANIPTRGHWLRFDPTASPSGDAARRAQGPTCDANVRVWMKRDDHTGSELMGNKVRKLEYLMADARAHDATHAITCGGEQSNHARATAFAAAQLGMKSVLILRTDDPTRPPAATGNILLDRLAGAELRWISREQWRDRERLLDDEAARVRAAGGRPYVIPEGGSNALGSWGYVRAAHELARDLDEASVPRPCTIVYACGSGGTGAGLALGAKLLGFATRGIRIAGVNVCDDRAYFVAAITRICADAEARWQLGAHVTAADIDIVDGHVGLGYAKSRPEELATIRAVASRDGVVLDPVYTGKAFHGVTAELARDPARFGAAVCFIHSGGMFGLFAPGIELGF